MHGGDLYVGIGPPGRGGRCRLTARWIGNDGESHERVESVGVLATGLVGPVPLADVVQDIVQWIQRFASAPPVPPAAGGFMHLLLDIAAPALYPVDWEAELSAPGLQSWTVVRYIDRSDESVGIAFELPARVLHAVGAGPVPVAVSQAQRRYFRLHRLSGVSELDLLVTARRGRFEVVHLVVEGRWDESSHGLLQLADGLQTGGPAIDAAALAVALRACGARLLVLETPPPHRLPPLLDLAHRLQRRGGPSILLLEAPTTAAIEELYLGLVHNQGIDGAAQAAARYATRHVLFEGIGGADALSIMALRDRTLARAMRMATVLDAMAPYDDSDRRLEGAQAGAAVVPLSELQALHQRAAALVQKAYDPSRESGAWIPLGDDAREADRLQQDVAAAAAHRGRVVNVGLWRAEAPEAQPLSAGEPPRTRQRCLLGVQIGPVAPWTLVRDGRPLPEADLARRYGDDGLDLRVVVFAQGFELDGDEATLRLPPPPAPSRRVTFKIGMPAEPGAHRIRVAIYHENNLLQSILLRLSVAPQDEAGAVANARPGRTPPMRAEVEYALSDTLSEPDRLPGRTVNILCNDGGDGTHTFAIVGAGFKKDLRFGEGRMRAAVDSARGALFDVAAERLPGKRPRYRFDTDNSGPPQQLAGDLIKLAECGHALFSTLVTGEDRAFKSELLKALGAGGATIQVSATVSAQYVFPWALVYDHPLVIGGLSLCPQFAADQRSGLPLAKATCFTLRCPNHGNTSIVCPSGFWGFKHLLEQPLSVVKKKVKQGSDAGGASGDAKAAAAPGIGAGDLVTRLAAGPAGTPVRALMAISRELDDVGDHVREMRGAAGWYLDVKDNKAEVLVNMQVAAQMGVPLIYFYCHGGRVGTNTWLGIGRGERLVPGDLEARDIDWSMASPLVLINGCHTVDLTPDDLISFNETLSWCRAAGAIGTEIDIPETLARDFARGFFADLAAERPVGVAIKQRRLALLARGNPLGLAYTPYCSASLQLVRQ